MRNQAVLWHHIALRTLFVLGLALLGDFLLFGSAQAEPIDRFLSEGIFDPALISEDDLYAALKAAYQQATTSAQKSQIADRWLKVKWWRLWEANAEMPPEFVVVGNTLPASATPSDNWHWHNPVPVPKHPDISPEHFRRVHGAPFGPGAARHGFQGTVPYLLPANGRLLQYVYLPETQQPRSIYLRIETTYLLEHPQRPISVQAYWTSTFRSGLDSENRPQSFWAGRFPQTGGWHLLAVDLTDIGLNGPYRSIRGIEYLTTGGQAWFGPTILQRPQVEIRGGRPYHVFTTDEPMSFDLIVHNFSATPERFSLHLTVSDYTGNLLQKMVYQLDIPAQSTHIQPLTLPPDSARYLVFEYSLHHGQSVVFQGHSAAVRIPRRHAGRNTDSKFGMMYWDQPGQELVDFYERLGVKLIILFPELHRLHRFDPQKFAVVPMLWSLPKPGTSEAQRLQKTIQPYLRAGHTLFSNFWETDLRVPAPLFASGMEVFSQTIKTVAPTAKTGVGGLAWFNMAYVKQLFQALSHRSQGTIDFLAAMSYTTPAAPEFSGLAREAAALKTLLHQHDSPQTELWNVEWAYFENLNVDADVWLNTGVPRHLIAPYTIRHHLTGFGAGIDRMIPGSLIYSGRTPLTKNYGHSMTLGRSSIFRYDLTPLPMLPAYATMTRLLEDKTYRADCSSLHANIQCQIYQAPDSASAETVIALWSVTGHDPIALSGFPDDQETRVNIISMIGEAHIQTPFRGALHLSVSPEPLYVVVPPRQTSSRKLEVRRDNLLFASIPELLELVPGQAQRVTLSYRIANPDRTPLQGILQLREPNWLKILSIDVRYANEMQQQLAGLMLDMPPALAETDVAFWLGREHEVEITYTVEIPAQIPRYTYYEEAAITQQPWFTITADILTHSANTLQNRLLAQAITPVSVRPPLDVKLHPFLARPTDVNAPQIQVQMTNHSFIERQGIVALKVPSRLEVTPGQHEFAVPAGATQTFTFHVQGGFQDTREYDLDLVVDAQLRRSTQHVVLTPQQRTRLDHYRRKDGYRFSHGIGEGFVIEALVSDSRGYETRQSRGFAFRPAVRAAHPIRIDGHLADWHDAVPLFVHPEGRLAGLTFFARDYGDDMQWTGLDDFSAAWQMLWDDEYLYLAIRTWDDQIVPYTPLGTFWNGDTITFQIDPLPDTTEAAPLPKSRDMWDIHTFEMTFQRSESGNEQAVLRRTHATHRHAAGISEVLQIAVQPLSDGLVYEVAIPWAELAPLSPKTSTWMGFSLVFYEDDGDGRETRLNWFGGSGGNGLAREPRLMGDVHLCR